MTSGLDRSVIVTALGMATSLGDAVTSCAAARAGLTRISELTSLDFHGNVLFGRETNEGGPAVFGSTVPGTEGFVGLAKVFALGRAALEDLLRLRPLSESDHARTGFVLNLSDHFVLDTEARLHGASALPSVEWRLRTEGLPSRLTEAVSLRLPREAMTLHYGGQAGTVSAIDDALTMMARDQVDRCIVGAIDSRIEPGFLLAAAAQRLLRTKDNPVGLIPGEAAAFFILERAREATHAGVSPVATVTTTAIVQDGVDMLAEDYVPTGVALAESLQAALRSSPPIGFSIGDLNGWTHRAVEWANAQLRLRVEPRTADVPVWFPALSFGDTGAASGVVGVCVASRAFARRYAPGNGAVVWLSSESGTKAAIVVRSP